MTEIETVHNAPPRLGILSMSVESIEDIFQLPPGYKIVGADYDERYRKMNFTVLSDALPEAEQYQALPQLALRVTVSFHHDAPIDYCKVTTDLKVL